MGQSENLGLEDIERLIIPYYEMLALSPATPGLVNGAYRVYRLLERIGGLMGILGNSRESARRYTTLEENVPDIEAFLDAFFPESPDCFVFGHTHKGGVAQLENSRETLVLNTGCWIDDERDDTIKGSVAVLDKGFRLVNVLD